jgi:hypothetical protein
MYTIFFILNCVEQLTFSKTFVGHLQFERWYFFDQKWNWSNPVDSQRLTGYHQLTKKWHLFKWCRPVDKIVATSFFEQWNFEQLIMSQCFHQIFSKSCSLKCSSKSSGSRLVWWLCANVKLITLTKWQV